MNTPYGRLQSHKVCPIGQSGSETNKNHEVTFLQFSVAHGFVEGERDRGGRIVTVFFNRYNHRDFLVLRKKGENANPFMWMDGRKVYVFAKGVMVESCLRVLDRSEEHTSELQSR